MIMVYLSNTSSTTWNQYAIACTSINQWLKKEWTILQILFSPFLVDQDHDHCFPIDGESQGLCVEWCDGLNCGGGIPTSVRLEMIRVTTESTQWYVRKIYPEHLAR